MFKVGDVIRCINSTDSKLNLEKNKIYVVEHAQGSFIILHNSTSEWFSDCLFELVVGFKKNEDTSEMSLAGKNQQALLNAIYGESGAEADYSKQSSSKLGSNPKSYPGTGIKHDQDKPDMSLLSSIALLEVAKVMTFGKLKYSANNWRGGFAWTRPLSAALRHIFAYLGGQDKDLETGISHLAHAICCLMFVLEFEVTHPELDDRHRGATK